MTEAAKVHSLQDIGDALAARNENRVIYTYTVPKKLAAECGVSSIGVVELTPDEMLRAQARSGGNQVAVGFELSKECLRRVDGKPVHLGDGSADVAWAKNAKLRTLIAQAYSDVHNPSKDDSDSFLDSRSVST